MCTHTLEPIQNEKKIVIRPQIILAMNKSIQFRFYCVSAEPAPIYCLKQNSLWMAKWGGKEKGEPANLHWNRQQVETKHHSAWHYSLFYFPPTIKLITHSNKWRKRTMDFSSVLKISRLAMQHHSQMTVQANHFPKYHISFLFWCTRAKQQPVAVLTSDIYLFILVWILFFLEDAFNC